MVSTGMPGGKCPEPEGCKTAAICDNSCSGRTNCVIENIGSSSGGILRGTYHVRPSEAARHTARKLFPRMRDLMEVRRHALKLSHWPDAPPGAEGGQALDLDWEWVKGLPKNVRDVGELRIDDEIGGFNNLRIIFYKAGPPPGWPKNMMWILDVFQKKRQDFSAGDLARFRLLQKGVIDCYYAIK